MERINQFTDDTHSFSDGLSVFIICAVLFALLGSNVIDLFLDWVMG